jgi:hypothetical protein
VESLLEGWKTFTALCDVLRLSTADLPRGDARLAPQQLPALELLRLQQIRDAVERFQDDLRGRIPPGEQAKAPFSSAPAIVLKYLERNKAHLFGHPARFDTDGTIVAIVERTNNILEHFFGQDKQRLRRRVGRAQLGQDLEQQPAQAVLVANLRHADYVQALCGTIETLPIALAALDVESAVPPGPPLREQRNKDLQRRVRELLEVAMPPGDSCPQAELEPIDIPPCWPELEPLGAAPLSSPTEF